MAHGTRQRRFVVNRRTGRIAIRSRGGTPARGTGALDHVELLEALIEVEELLSPAFAHDQVSPVDLIALLADAMYIRLTGELEAPSRELHIQLCNYILTAWSQGLFTPSAACPYTITEILAACGSQVPLREQEAQPDDETMRAALSAILESHPPADEGQPSPYERLKHDMQDIDEARDELVRMGVRALRTKQYTLAEHYFRQAIEADMLDKSEACYYLALCRLWQLDFDEASYLFEVDSQDREGEAPLSWLLAAWCAMCVASSRASYLAGVREEMEDQDEGDPLTHLREMFDFDYEDYADASIQELASAVFAYLRGNYQACLELLDAFVPEFLEVPAWFAPFWSAMALAELQAYDEADTLLREALTYDIPPLLLLPLRWLEQSQPALYERSVAPTFTRFDLWEQVAARKERERILQDEHRYHLQWLIDHIDEDFPGFSPAFRELDAMRERGRPAQQAASLECRYLAAPGSVNFAHTYAEIAERWQMSRGGALPVFLATIPPPRSPRPATYLVSTLLEQLGDPFAHKHTSADLKRSRLVQRLKERQVELIILTNLEDLTTPSREKLLLGELEWIRRFFATEIGSIPLVLVGDRSIIEAICEANTDFARMLREIVVPPPRLAEA
jgi:tetratricopeptide (TPR) repeat protein